MLISFCALVGNFIPSGVFQQKMQSCPTSQWIPKFNKRNFVNVKVMLSSPIKVYEYYSEQSILVAISYFRAQQIPSWTKEVRPFIILLMELFKFILTFDEAQLNAGWLLFKTRLKLDSAFSLYQSQTQSTIPGLVRNGNLIVFYWIDLKWTSASKPLLVFNHV